nr:caspase family protein [Terriglobales bacterium]
MASSAILVGNSQYRFLNELACCRDDVSAMKELLEATEKYAAIEVIENVDADELKSRMRAAISGLSDIDELFFYFTGHGHQQDDEFYYCATAFDLKRPNETGLSTSELHTILR